MNTIFSTKWNQQDAPKVWEKIFSTKKSPDAVGPYSKAVLSWNLLFCSGQIGLDPQTMSLVSGWTIAELHQVCINIEWVLEEYGCTIDQVIKTMIFLRNISEFEAVNEVYGQYFSHKPARSLVEVSNLPKWAMIEIEVIAQK